MTDARKAHLLSEIHLAATTPTPELGPVETTSPADPELRRALAYGFDAEPSPDATGMARTLADAFGPAAMAVIHYGSRARSVDARADSAYDFFVIVDEYRAAYESLARSIPSRVGARTATALAHVLPPNVHALPPVPDGGRRNKCGVLTIRALRAAARLRSSDHFVAARLFQHVQLLWVRDVASADAVRDALIDIRARTFEWGRSFLPETFSAEAYCRSILETSFAGEIRPEAGERPAHLLDAQRAVLLPVYGALLEGLAREGVLERVGDSYRQTQQPTPRMRRRWEWYFRVSKARGCVRWAKHIVQYDGWLDYIVQKITRHNEVEVELTERERRWPLIFLWPKVFLFFRERSRWEVRR